MNKCTELKEYAFLDSCLLDFFLILAGTTTSQNSRNFSTPCKYKYIYIYIYIWGPRLIEIYGSLIWSKTLMELVFNPCGKFLWSPEDPVSQIHPPHLLVGAPGIFRFFKVCSDANERMGCRKQREATAPIKSLVKLQPWFLGLRWKTCLRQNCSLGFSACSEGPSFGQNIIDDDDDDIYGIGNPAADLTVKSFYFISSISSLSLCTTFSIILYNVWLKNNHVKMFPTVIVWYRDKARSLLCVQLYCRNWDRTLRGSFRNTRRVCGKQQDS